MKIARTANSGILLETDGKRILIDGVCKEYPPYLGTPDSIRRALLDNPPDAMLCTHYHYDHFDDEFALDYKKTTLRSHYGPEFAIKGKLGEVSIEAVPTSHIGRAGIDHVSYIIQGSRTLYFMGDASPSELKKLEVYPRPDVMIVPYAYALTPSAWKRTKDVCRGDIILIHMPLKSNDPHGLWDAVEKTVGKDRLIIPDIGEMTLI